MLRTSGSCCKLEDHLDGWKAILLCHSERSEESQFIFKNQTTRIVRDVSLRSTWQRNWLRAGALRAVR